MAQRDMSYEEYAVELANAYPDLDLQNLSVDDIKTMMGHGLKDEPDKYGLAPVTECAPTARRRSSKQRSRSRSSTEEKLPDAPTKHGEDFGLKEEVKTEHGIEPNFQSLADFSQLGDISKLPYATQQALYASAALLSFSRGANAMPLLKPSDITQSLSTNDSTVEANTTEIEEKVNKQHPKKKLLTQASSSSLDETIASVAHGYALDTKPNTKNLQRGASHDPMSSYVIPTSSTHRRLSEPTALRRQRSTSRESAPTTHNKLRQLLEAGRMEHNTSQNVVTSQEHNPSQSVDYTSPSANKHEDAAAAEALVAAEAPVYATYEDSPVVADIKEDSLKQEQLKTMNPGHITGEVIFKVPEDKKLPQNAQTRAIELDTPPPAQTTLPVHYGFAPNVAIRTDNAAMPLTPPQASPPEINMSDMTSAASLSNLMSKHLLSTTQGLKAAAALTGLAGVATSTLPDGLNPGFAIPNSLAMSLAGLMPIVTKPTTQISYLPVSNPAQNALTQLTKFEPNGTVLGTSPVADLKDVNLLNAGMIPPNGLLPNTVQPAIPGHVKTPSKKSKKRRRKSESSDGLGSSFGSPDGSPRLIKKIGRVIQTVENEQDLNNKVDAMLKNIMGKFQQRQGDEGQGQSEASPSTPSDEPVTEESIQRVAQQIGAMAAHANPPNLPNQCGGIRPSPKKKSKSKKKSPAPQLTNDDSHIQQQSPAPTLTLPVHEGTLGLEPKAEPLIQYPYTMLGGTGNVQDALNQSQHLLAGLQNTGLGLQTQIGQVQATQSTSILSQPITSISATQLMPTSEALAAAKKMLQDAGIVLPETVVKATTMDVIPSDVIIQSSVAMQPTQFNPVGPSALSMATAGLAGLATGLQLPVVPHTTTEPLAKINAAPFTVSPNVNLISQPDANLYNEHDPVNTQQDIRNPKLKKKKKKPADKLSEADITNIAQLLKMANSQYFAEFFNQLQAFALGKNPEWMLQYPNIASFMGLKSDSKEKAKQILEYMREQTGIGEGEQMTPQSKLNYDQAVAEGRVLIQPDSKELVIVNNSSSPPHLEAATLQPPTNNTAGSSKYLHMNGNEPLSSTLPPPQLTPETSFIDSFQHFLHNKVPTTSTTAGSAKSRRSSRGTARSPVTSSIKTSGQNFITSNSSTNPVSWAAADLIQQTGVSTNNPVPLNSQLKDPSLLAFTAAAKGLPQTTSLDNALKALIGSACLDTTNNPDMSVLIGGSDPSVVHNLDNSGHVISDMLHGSSLVERLKRNYSDPIEEVPKCDCLKGVEPAIAVHVIAPSTKSRKRRRNSESSDGHGFSFVSPDGTARLIKDLGRVIPTVENEKDLNTKVDTMLKNIMGKFQQLQDVENPDENEAPPVSTCDELETEDSKVSVAQQISAMEALANLLYHYDVLRPPAPKNKSKPRKKPPTPTLNDYQIQQQSAERLKRNQIEEAPKCDCRKGSLYSACHDEVKEGPFYTHLGAASDVAAVREMLEQRLHLSGSAIRIERVLHTGKAGKTSEGCPIPRWILRRAGPDEKVLCIVRPREGHHCHTAVLVTAIVLWEGLSRPRADQMYTYLNSILPGQGGGAKRHKRMADKRECLCSAGSGEHSGEALHLGCSYSTHARTCRHAKNSGTPRKFKIDNVAEEALLEQKLQGLATELAPLCKATAPQAFKHMCQFEEEGLDCRLGNVSGRPFSGVTALIDSSSHCQKLRTHSNNGCSMIVTLKAASEAEAEVSGCNVSADTLHVYPMCVLDTCDETGNHVTQFNKLRSGAIEYISKQPVTSQTNSPSNVLNPRVVEAVIGNEKQQQQHSKKRKVARSKKSKPKRNVLKQRVVPLDIIKKLNLKSVNHRVKDSRSTKHVFSASLKTPFIKSARLKKSSTRPSPLRKPHRRRHTLKSRLFTQKAGQVATVRKSISKKKGRKTKRWQEMMSDPAFVNNLMTVGQQMYGSEAETMVGRLKTVAEQETLLQQQQESSSDPSSSSNVKQAKSPKPVSVNDNAKLCSQFSAFLDNSSTWEAWYRQSQIENGSATVNQTVNHDDLAPPTKRARTVTPGTSSDTGAKPEDVAGWGMYSMPPNRTVFDIDSPRKSISTELLRSVNRHGSQINVHRTPSVVNSDTKDGATSQQNEQVNASANGNSTDSGTVTQNHELLQHSKDKTGPQNETTSPLNNNSNSSHTENHVTNADNTGVVKSVKNARKCSARLLPDTDMGGVAIALTHGSILFEVSKRELHASAFQAKKPTNNPTISLLFHQQKGLNLPKHGRQEHLQFEEMRRSKEEGTELKVDDIDLPEAIPKVKVEQENSSAPGILVEESSKYKYLWDTKVVLAETPTYNSASYSWLKPQTAVSGPYQRWL